MKKLLPLILSLTIVFTLCYLAFNNSEEPTTKVKRKIVKIDPKEEAEEESLEARASAIEQRFLYEYYRQVDPKTGEIPRAEKLLEFDRAKKAKLKSSYSSRSIQSTFVSRGPSNFGGRTRALAVDISDNTGNTILAGGVSGGVFRTTDGGATWTKVSSNDEIHNVTTIVQDPTSTNIWYYGTGEASGNSASLSGSSYLGQGIWKSTNGGLTWAQMPTTASTQESFNNRFDTVFKLAVDPNTGTLYAAINGRVSSFNGISWDTEVTNPGGTISGGFATDVVIASDSRAYAALSGNCDSSVEGVWTRNPSTGIWTRISNGIFTPAGRVVLALAPSNQNKLYVLFDNGNDSDCDTTPAIEADLWMWNQTNTSFTNYSSKLPDETGCSNGNDPFAIQGGYDLVVSVKPDNDNFVIIGGTNAYKKTDITAAGTFTRIGGYKNTSGYSVYGSGADPGDTHHPDIHALVFNPFNNLEMFSGTDGGVHKTTDITATTVSWTDLNNNYQTFQYYHVGIDPMAGSDIVIGGAQDNGTKAGGVDWGMPDPTTQASVGSGDGVAVAISRDNACLPFFFGSQGGTIVRDCPSGSEITPDGSDSDFVTYFHLDPDNNNALYYAGKGALYRTTNSSGVTTLTWDNLGSPTGFGIGDNDEWIQTFSTSWGAYNASTSYLLIGGDSGHILRLNNPQNVMDVSSAVDITPPTATIGFPSIVTGLAIHPSNNDIVLATYSNYGNESIFLTTNATDPTPSWTLVENILSAHSIRSAAIVEDNGETQYFVGTARGLYSSPDPTTTDWVREAPSQIGFALVSSLKYRPGDHKLLIGTHGNGMYEATISSVLGLEDFDNISDAIKLYPNPVKNSLNVKLPQADGLRISYTISNVSGQTITKGVLDTESIDVSQLAQGMYFLQLKTNDGRKGAKSFLKQ